MFVLDRSGIPVVDDLEGTAAVEEIDDGGTLAAELDRDTAFLRLRSRTMKRVTRRFVRPGVGPWSLMRHVGRRTGRTCDTRALLCLIGSDEFRLLHVADASTSRQYEQGVRSSDPTEPGRRPPVAPA